MHNKKVYIKDNSFDSIYKSVNYDFYFKSRVLSAMMLAAGAFVLGTQVIVPLVFFKTQDVISDAMRSSVLGIASGFSNFSFDELKSDLGITKEAKFNVIPSNKPVSDDPEYVESPQTEPPLAMVPPTTASTEEALVPIPEQKANVLGTNAEVAEIIPAKNPEDDKFFHLTIPKLKIENAVVEINSPSLTPDRYLGHYKGSSMPGEFGNSFIYGHSVLPWFYNPRNYLTIFSTLDKLDPGDTFTVNYKDKKYTYKVVYTEILPPSQIDPLGEFRPKQLNESTITLMTCWPAGLKSKRLMVRALLIK
jgi:LPXTG-site transpeptidase (sortase) family protein